MKIMLNNGPLENSDFVPPPIHEFIDRLIERREDLTREIVADKAGVSLTYVVDLLEGREKITKHEINVLGKGLALDGRVKSITKLLQNVLKITQYFDKHGVLRPNSLITRIFHNLTNFYSDPAKRPSFEEGITFSCPIPQNDKI